MVAVLDSAYVISCSTLQGLYKTKLIYISSLCGLLLNAILDIPMMNLFNKIGIYPYYGAIAATIIGYIIALGIPMYVLYKKEGFRYTETIKTLPKCILSVGIITLLWIIYKKIMPTMNDFVGNTIYLTIIGIITLFVYYVLNKEIIINLLKEKNRR